MTITLRITLPATPPAPDAKRLLNALIPFAKPALLAVADTAGMALPARLLLEAALTAAHATTAPSAAPAV